MIPNDHAIMLYKFSEKRWIDEIISGYLSLSCPGAFILQAKRTKNYVQGDLLEGVFARLKKTDPRITEMKNYLGRDLETIEDGEFLFLRRKSAKFRPIFCIYAYTADDVLKNNSILKAGKQKIRFSFDDRIYNGFANSSIKNVVSDLHRFTVLFLQPYPFIERIKLSLSSLQIPYELRRVHYRDIHNEVFFIEPTPQYDELFNKDISYEYQHEARLCLVGEKLKDVFDRYTLRIERTVADDCHACHCEIYVEFVADIRETKDGGKDSVIR